MVSMLRGLLLDNLGLKLVALLLAVMVYLNVFTERSATMVVSFPIHFTELGDSLALVSPVPTVVEAELRGTGKQFIRLWLTEPRVRISLAGLGSGRHRRRLEPEDLPLIASDKLVVLRMVSSPEVEWRIAAKTSRVIPVAVRIEGTPARGMVWNGSVAIEPAEVRVSGPTPLVAALDSLRLAPLSIAGRQGKVRESVKPDSLPAGIITEPGEVTVTLTLERAGT